MSAMFVTTDIPLMLLLTVVLYRLCCLQSSQLSKSVQTVSHRDLLSCVVLSVLSSSSPPAPP